MRARRERRQAWRVAGLTLAGLLSLAPASAGDASAPARELDSAQLDAAVAALRADSDLGGQYQMHVLRWARQAPDPDASADGPWQRLQRWLAGAWGWAAAGTRWLVLGLAALGVATLCIWLVRLFRARQRTSAPLMPSRPTHVLGLDIRPQSLPDEVGAAALALWNLGERRAALALLYRGLLSRLLHVFTVPITDSSTEGECLSLATRALSGAPLTYVRRLITIWQRAVYASQPPSDEELVALCETFDVQLPPARPASGVAP